MYEIRHHLGHNIQLVEQNPWQFCLIPCLKTQWLHVLVGACQLWDFFFGFKQSCREWSELIAHYFFKWKLSCFWYKQKSLEQQNRINGLILGNFDGGFVYKDFYQVFKKFEPDLPNSFFNFFNYFFFQLSHYQLSQTQEPTTPVITFLRDESGENGVQVESFPWSWPDQSDFISSSLFLFIFDVARWSNRWDH